MVQLNQRSTRRAVVQSLRALVAIAAILLLLAPARAQMGPSGPQSAAQLLWRESVQQELSLTDEQLRELDSVHAAIRERMADVFRLDQPERGRTMRRVMKEHDEKAAAVLTSEQTQRLRQLFYQSQGTTALTEPEVARAIGLSADQQQRIQEINDEIGRQARALSQPGVTPEDAAERVRSLRQAGADQMVRVLDEGQASRWKEMLGPPFPGELRGGPFGSRRTPGAHDPSTIVKHKDEYWVFTTGWGVSTLRSDDLVHWQRGPAVFPEPPGWITSVVPEQRGHFWAPDVIEHDGRFLLYYSVSAFGKQTSAIALASNPTLDPEDPEYRWTDHGIVIQTDERSDFNAIDPSVIRTQDGTLWLALGSFWSGIKLIQLDPANGKRISPDSPVYSIAQKNQIEATTIFQHGEYFYQFVNWGWCCRGVWSTYNIRVGRSREITGPYLDREGVDLSEGGGSLVLDTEGSFIGPGHPAVFEEGGRYWLSYHFYDGAQNGRSRLAIRPLEWSEDGWPRVVGEPITPVVGGGEEE